MWIATPACDYVFVDARTTGLHRAHITAHELAHVAFDHGGPRVLADDVVARLLPDLDPDVIVKVLGRQSYSSREEQQAEVLASLLLSGPDATIPDDDTSASTTEVCTLARSLGSRRGHVPERGRVR